MKTQLSLDLPAPLPLTAAQLQAQREFQELLARLSVKPRRKRKRRPVQSTLFAETLFEGGR